MIQEALLVFQLGACVLPSAQAYQPSLHRQEQTCDLDCSLDRLTAAAELATLSASTTAKGHVLSADPGAYVVTGAAAGSGWSTNAL